MTTQERRPQRNPEPVELTERQSAVFAYIAKRIVKGIPPSVREIMEHFGFRSLNAVSCHVAALVRKGWIERDTRLARGLRLTEAGKGPRGIPVITLQHLED
jgi:repressor LexA